MTLVIPPGFGQASVQFRNSGDPDPWYVTFGVDLSEAGGDYTLAAAQIAGAVVSSLLGSMTTDTILSGVQLRVGQDGGEPLTIFVPQNEAGSSSANKLPQNCAVLITKVTNLGGRKGKGRMFWPNLVAEGVVNNVGVIEAGAVAEFQTQANDLMTYLDGEGDPPAEFATPMVLLHNGEGPGTPAPTPVERLVVQNVISTQRRRLR